jgi:hypothetical protein
VRIFRDDRERGERHALVANETSDPSNASP